MSHSQQRRTRSERVATLRLPPGRIMRGLAELRRLDVLIRVLSIVAVVTIVSIAGNVWRPPLNYREGDIARRDVISRVEFEVPDEAATLEARSQARRTAPLAFRNDPAPIRQLQSELLTKLEAIGAASSLDALDADHPEIWPQFVAQDPNAAGEETTDSSDDAAQFQEFQRHITDSEKWTAFKDEIDAVFDRLAASGLIVSLPPDAANQRVIAIARSGGDEELEHVDASEVLLENRRAWLLAELNRPAAATAPLAERLYPFIRDRLPEQTLTHDSELSQAAGEQAAANVEPLSRRFAAGLAIVDAGNPISLQELQLLRSEHAAYVAATHSGFQSFARAASMVALIVAIVALCWGYILARHREKLIGWRNFFLTLAFAVLGVLVALWLRGNSWHAEIVPLYVFAVSMTIAFGRHLSMWLSLAVGTVLALVAGLTMWEYFQLMGVTSCAILTLNPIRSRLRLIGISGVCGAVGFALVIVLGIVSGQPADQNLFWSALLLGLWTVGSGFLITGLLPILEWLFGVLTDLSLLELGNASHPLLQELVRRAPGTYNHSINVASLSEAAAEAIGARSLLVRVGAYFHDIGKMFKPGYFIENQGESGNRHDSLVPAMSTLIIIAHIKDGADLARTHHLPLPIIDFIEQHHGTTLVRFFYERANEQHRQDPDSAEVDESDFRYPGPKPQSKEAAVMMLADSVESACRTLVEPGPARIESLVREIAIKRLLDGQFDESGINLTELRIVEDSLIKSLIAYYHGRVRYPDQQTA